MKEVYIRWLDRSVYTGIEIHYMDIKLMARNRRTCYVSYG